jgi:Tol biopolymer transport system component/predicted Ser/Thr protein kinase
MPASPGDRLGPYEILDAIGAGGMGEVYKARDTRLDRLVAVKLCKDQFSERFEREARAVAALNHPNICTLHDVGPNFLVMEYIDGPTLAQRITVGAIPMAEALPIARQIAEALEAAHDKGIVHRDLKPGNIKLTPEAKVKVLDFGLAKAFDDEGSAADPTTSPTLTLSATRAGVILGTAGYMSPEQARGLPADKRADIWSYGVVVLEILTGRLTFSGETVSDTLAAVLRADMDWKSLPADTPASVRRLLRRCLVRDRKQRLPDIAVARMEIDEALSGPSEAVPALPAKRPPAWMAAAILCALAAVAIAVVHFRESPPPPAETVRLQIPLPPKTTFMGHLSISPDGRRVIFAAAGEDGRSRLWVRALDSLEAHPLPGTEGAGYFFWSPDSRFVGYRADGKLKKVEVSGGPPQALCDNTFTFLGGSWNQSGIILLGGGGSNIGLSRVTSAGGPCVPLTKPDPEVFHSWPFFLPDGKHFLYLVSGGEQANSFIHVASLNSQLEVRDSKRLMGSRTNAVYVPSAKPDQGHLLFIRETSLMAQPFDAGRLELTGEAFPVAEHVGLFLTRGFFGGATNGRLVYRAGIASAWQPAWFDRQGRSLQMAGPSANITGLSLSHDNARAAMSMYDQFTPDIWLVDMMRHTSTRFTSDPGSERNPIWSPDDSQIAFSSGNRILQKISSGAEKEQVLLVSDSAVRTNDWSADGKLILYSRQDPKTRWDLWVLPLDGDRKPRPYLQSEFNETHGQFSPDGHWVAYDSDESGRQEVYVQQFPAAGGKWQISSAGGSEPKWRRDGKELFFLGADRGVMAVDIKTSPRFEAGIPRGLFQHASISMNDYTAYYFAPAADGQRFLMLSTPQGTEDAPITVVLNWTGTK